VGLVGLCPTYPTGLGACPSDRVSSSGCKAMNAPRGGLCRQAGRHMMIRLAIMSRSYSWSCDTTVASECVFGNRRPRGQQGSWLQRYGSRALCTRFEVQPHDHATRLFHLDQQIGLGCASAGSADGLAELFGVIRYSGQARCRCPWRNVFAQLRRWPCERASMA